MYLLVSKTMWVCFPFVLLRSTNGPENSRHSVNQSDARLKPVTTWSLALSRALGSLVGFTLCSHWFLRVFTFFQSSNQIFNQNARFIYRTFQ